MASQPLAIDVETVGLPWDGFMPAIQEYLLERARDDEERAAFPEQLALYPGTAQIVAIGMWMPGEQRGGVLVNNTTGTRAWENFYDGARVFHGDEAEILTEFWQLIQRSDTIVTYNGRTFDCPILMLRSAVLGVRPLPQPHALPLQLSAALRPAGSADFPPRNRTVHPAVLVPPVRH